MAICDYHCFALICHKRNCISKNTVIKFNKYVINQRSIRKVIKRRAFIMLNKIDLKDNRWSGYVPWFLRHDDFTGTGNYYMFFDRLSHRSCQLFYYDELGISNKSHFGSILTSKSLNRYKYEFSSKYLDASLAYSIRDYFDPRIIHDTLQKHFKNHPLKNKLDTLSLILERVGCNPESCIIPAEHKKTFNAYEIAKTEYQKISEKYYQHLILERLGVLEVMLKNLPNRSSQWFDDFIKDIRCYLAEAGLMLDIDENNYDIILLEEPLLQKGVLENLLPRLKSKFPERADELVKAYHDMLDGNKFDDIFISAFKTLEEIGRSLTSNKKFEFNQKFLDKYFHKLHKTTHTTILKLAAHRGDEGGHGKNAPTAIEIRYLLFSICNIALLILEYNE